MELVASLRDLERSIGQIGTTFPVLAATSSKRAEQLWSKTSASGAVSFTNPLASGSEAGNLSTSGVDMLHARGS